MSKTEIKPPISAIPPSKLINQLTVDQIVAVYEGRIAYRVVEITAVGAGVYNTPDDVVYADVIGIAGGGGGGSGRLGNTSNNRAGGTAGGCGLMTRLRLTRAQLGASQNFYVGDGGVGGLGQSGSVQLNGLPGAAGENTTFGAYLEAIGGAAGIGGTASTSTGNSPAAQGAGLNTPSVGGNSYGNTGSLAGLNTTGQATTSVALNTSTTNRFPNGGSGGGLNTANKQTEGGSGGRWFTDTSGWQAAAVGGIAGGGDGGDGSSNVWTTIGLDGTGGTIGVGLSGAGGGSGQAILSGRGGDGGLYGGGGGGGGGSTQTLGATARGGNGAQGCLVIIECYVTA